MSDLPDDPKLAQKTGYKVPPEHGKIKPGERRNPGGRRKQRKSDFDLNIISKCESRIPNSSNTILDAVFNGLIKGAAAGNIRAAKTIIEMYRDALRSRGLVTASNEADVEAAKRILDLDPRLLAEFSGKEPVASPDSATANNDGDDAAE